MEEKCFGTWTKVQPVVTKCFRGQTQQNKFRDLLGHDREVLSRAKTLHMCKQKTKRISGFDDQLLK